MLSVVADECQRLQAELMIASQSNLARDVQGMIREIRCTLYSENFVTSTIFTPFKELITQPTTTDIITSMAISSVLCFIDAGLFKTTEEFNDIIQSLCNCQYQVTSEAESLNLSVQILNCFSQLINPSNIHNISITAMDTLFQYCEQDVRQLAQNGIHLTALSNLLAKVSFLIIDNDTYQSLANDVIYSLFAIADFSRIDSGWVARGAALYSLVQCSHSAKITSSRDMVEITCVLLNQQISLSDGKDNYVLALRLFFNVFRNQWLTYIIPFATCFSEIIEQCTSQSVSQPIRSIAFDLLVDFITIPNFIINFFANFNQSALFPNLFKNFLSLIVGYASRPNVPRPLQNAHATSVRLLQMIILQLSSSIPNNISVSNGMPESTTTREESTQFIKLSEFATKFNSNPSYATQGEQTPAEVAKALFIAPGVSGNAIGELFSKNSDFCRKTLEEFLKLFDFSNLSFDQSIRLFLTSFTIQGEGQIVDRNMEAFAEAFFETHQNENFKNAAAVHILSYAWLMLHTAFYKQQVGKKTTLPEFFSMLKRQNDGEDFDSAFLTKIFNSVKRSAVEIDQDERSGGLSYWELVIQRQRAMGIQATNLEPSSPQFAAIVAQLFGIVYHTASPIFAMLYENALCETSIALSAFEEAAAIASRFGSSELLDSAVMTLCKFVSSGNGAQSALKSLSHIINAHGAYVREGWRSFIDVLVGLFRADILPEEMRSQTALAGDSQTVVIGPWMNARTNRHNSTSLLSMFKILSSGEDSSNIGDSERELKRGEFRDFIKQCDLGTLTDRSLSFTQPSLSYLSQYLSLFIHESISNINERCGEIAFCVHLLTQIAIVNGDRAGTLFPGISQLFISIYTESQVSKPWTMLLQRVVTSMYTLMDHLWGQVKLRSELLKIVDAAASLSKPVAATVIPELLGGFQVFLGLQGQSFVEMFEFRALLAILRASVATLCQIASSILTQFLTLLLTVQNQPGIERFTDFWIPLIQTSVIYCVKDPSPDPFIRFGNLSALLYFGGSELSAAQWESLFESSLFPAITVLPQEVLTSREPSKAVERATLMTKVVFKSFLRAFPVLSQLPQFDSIWLKLLEYSQSVARSNQELMDAIPAQILNAALVMKSSGVFEGNSRKKLWSETRNVIERLSPQFKDFVGKYVC